MKCPKCQHENPESTKFCGECGTQLIPQPEAQALVTETLETSQEELVTGSVFAGRYQVIEELGKGGMGKVYRVLDKKLNEEVALKLIKPEIASDKKTLERFKNELKLARKVVQKNVGRMFDIGEESGIHYITMEYVPGEDLKSFIRRIGQMPVGKTIAIAKQICAGLSEAHSIGIVHRDLKPSNVMIDKNGNARIMDFGIARSIEAKKITGAGVIIGTPEYMSPEQVEGKETDHRSDIYSLGVLLYELLSGRLPFEGDTPLSIAIQHRNDIPRNPSELNTQIPIKLSQIILNCLEKEKTKRYQSAKDLLDELNKIDVSISSTKREIPLKEAIMEKKENTLSEKERQVRYKNKFIIAIAAILPALITFLLVSKYYSRKALKTYSSTQIATLSGRPLASYRFYPVAVSPEGSPYIDKALFMDAVNSLRENPDARAVADLIYLERKENFTLRLGESDRKLFQDLVAEVPVPDATNQEEYIDRIFFVYKLIVDGIGQTFAGTPVEIVLHDIRNPMRSIQALQNTISGRQLYQPTTNFGIELIKWYAKHPQQGSSFISYSLTLADGTPIKSSTIPLYDPEYGLLGSICLNIRLGDISETTFDEKTKQFLAAFRRTSSNIEIDEIIDNTRKNLSPRQPDK